jgi:hypothetical protein
MINTGDRHNKCCFECCENCATHTIEQDTDEGSREIEICESCYTYLYGEDFYYDMMRDDERIDEMMKKAEEEKKEVLA